MMFGDFRALLLTLFFVAPGYVCVRFFMAFRKQPAVDGMSGFLNCFLISCVLAAAWFPFLGSQILAMTSHPEGTSIGEDIILMTLLLVWPAAAGLGLGWTFHLRKIREFLLNHGLYFVHPVDTAWDYAFGLCRNGAYLSVHLDDGTRVTGYFGPQSLVSTASEERDIFLENVCVEKKGKPVLSDPPISLYLRPSCIKKIEFLSGGNDHGS